MADSATGFGHSSQPRPSWADTLDAGRSPAVLRDCLMALIDATPGIVMVSSSQGRLLFMNGVGRQILGIGAHTSIAARTVFDIYSPQSCDALLDEAIPTCLRSGMWRGEMTLLDSGGAEVPVSQVLMAHRVREQQGRETTTLSSIAWDIREMKNIERQLRHQATHDALTDLPNRMLLLDRLEHAIVVAGRKGGAVGVLFLDLDGFKQVNDTLGHEMADQLLCALGRRLVTRLRAEDTIARYGGDEFVVVIPDLATAEDTARVARQVRQAVEETFALGRETLRLQASIGVAVYPHDGRDAGALLRRADRRMYEQKSRERGAGSGPGPGSDAGPPPAGDPLAAA